MVLLNRLIDGPSSILTESRRSPKTVDATHPMGLRYGLRYKISPIVEPSVGESIEMVLGSDNTSYAVITLRFSAGTRFMTRIAVFDSWNCRFFFRLTACSIDCNEASSKA